MRLTEIRLVDYSPMLTFDSGATGFELVFLIQVYLIIVIITKVVARRK
jgi:hypothetical protein